VIPDGAFICGKDKKEKKKRKRRNLDYHSKPLLGFGWGSANKTLIFSKKTKGWEWKAGRKKGVPELRRNLEGNFFKPPSTFLVIKTRRKRGGWERSIRPRSSQREGTTMRQKTRITVNVLYLYKKTEGKETRRQTYSRG